MHFRLIGRKKFFTQAEWALSGKQAENTVRTHVGLGCVSSHNSGITMGYSEQSRSKRT